MNLPKLVNPAALVWTVSLASKDVRDRREFLVNMV
jgi:hypothetical protein